MNDETALRTIARESIATGMLPRHDPRQTWGGPGTGMKCALCGARVGKDELEFEVEFDRDRIHMHLACFSAWEAERRAIGLSQGENARSAQSRAVSSSSGNRVLPDRQGDGKMVADGGKRAYEPGAA